MEKRKLTPSDAEITPTEVTIDDRTLINIGFVKESELQSINLSKISDPKPQDIQQANLGNCFFLVALSSLLDKHPKLLKKIFNVNTQQNKVEITLYDTNDLSKKITYILDPTIVVTTTKLTHTNPVIYFLEKAYAIHRMQTEPKKYSDREIVIKGILEQHQVTSIKSEGYEKAVTTLLALEKLEVIEKKLKDDITYVLQNAILKNNIEKSSLSKIQLDIYNALEASNNDELIAMSKLQHLLMPRSIDYIRSEIYDFLNKQKKAYVDYSTALKAGFSSKVYQSLLGIEALKVEIEEEDSFRYLLSDLLKQLYYLEVTDLSKQEQQVIQRMFKDNTSEEFNFFVQAVKSTSREKLKELDLMLKSYDEHSNKPDKHTLLMQTFEDLLANQTDNPPGIKKRTLDKLKHYVNEHIPYKRGTGIYTRNQNELYDRLFGTIAANQLISIKTRDLLGKEVLKQKNGLIGNHVYEVVNCYERNGKKFILLHNPWGDHVRDYYYKNKSINNKSVSVLAAEKKVQTSSFSFRSAFSKFSTEKNLSSESIENIANPNTPLHLGNGYFELELSDLQKNFSEMYIGQVIFTQQENILNKTI